MYLDDRDVSIEFVAQRADAQPKLSVERQIARSFVAFVCQRTGRSPGSAEVVQTDEGLAITLRNRVSPVAVGPTAPYGESQPLGELLRGLLAESSNWLHQEIARITGRQVHSATATVSADLGAVVLLVKQQATGGKAITSVDNGAPSHPTVSMVNHGATIPGAFARLTTGRRAPRVVGAGNLVPTVDLLSELERSERFALRLEVLRNLGSARLERERLAATSVDVQSDTEANQG